MARHSSRFFLALLALTGCGSGGGNEPVTVSTLAYVVTECSGDTIRQSLQIRQGEQPPITVVEHAAVNPAAVFNCSAAASGRNGPLFAELGVFRRLGVTPDGSQVVFEVTDDVTEFVNAPLLFPPHALPTEQKGIFAVGADGKGSHRLGDASSVVSYHLSWFTFSPDSQKIAYTDRGLSGDHEDTQIFTLDLVTKVRRQVTQLPPWSGPWPGTYQPFFNDDQTITFSTHSNADGKHPGGNNIVVTVNTDGENLKVAAPVVALPGSELLTSFRITGSELDAALLTLDGIPVNPEAFTYPSPIGEVFDIDRDNNILQLTNFRRVDTFAPTVSADGQRVLFSASADPLGTNPDENCQMFSIDRTGGDLRQLTNFHDGPEGRHSMGCIFVRRPRGCMVYASSRDIRTDAVLFYSSCDPFGTNPYGSQVFAMHSDGTGLRQLTETRGLLEASGAIIVEVPYPIAWPGFQVRNQF